MPQLDILTWETHLFSLLFSVVVGYLLVNHVVIPHLFVSFHVKAFCLYHLENMLFSVNSYLYFIVQFDNFFKNISLTLKLFFNSFYSLISAYVNYLLMVSNTNHLLVFFRVSFLNFFYTYLSMYLYFLFANTKNCFYLMFNNSLE